MEWNHTGVLHCCTVLCNIAPLVHTMALLSYYSDLSLWDIHRTQVPLLTFLRPDVAEGVVNSLVAMYQEGGVLPRWPIANGEGLTVPCYGIQCYPVVCNCLQFTVVA